MLKTKSRMWIAVIGILLIGHAFAADVELVQKQNQIDIVIKGKTITTWVAKTEWTKPILFPVRTLSGTLITRGFPLEKIEGETTDHPHHTGIFFTYDGVNGMTRDKFWGATKPLPQIKQVKITEMKTDKGKGILSAVLDWNGDTGKTYLVENRTMVFYPEQKGYAIDFTMVLTAKDTTIVFEDTKEGMFAIRVADWLSEQKGTGKYLNSRGEELEKGVWGKRAEWVRLEGSKDGKTVGIAILNHPKSCNYPTYWHARGYGLFSADPLGQLDFQKGTKAENPQPFHLTLKPGQGATFKFLMLIYDGSRPKEDLEKVFKDYSK